MKQRLSKNFTGLPGPKMKRSNNRSIEAAIGILDMPFLESVESADALADEISGKGLGAVNDN